MMSLRESVKEDEDLGTVKDVSSDWNITGVTATCYPGGLSLEMNESMIPKSGAAEEGVDYFRKTASIDSDTRDEPVALAGEVVMNESSTTTANTTYKCQWQYQTRGKRVIDSLGSVKQIEDAASQIKNHFKERYSGTPGLKMNYGLNEGQSEFKTYATS